MTSPALQTSGRLPADRSPRWTEAIGRDLRHGLRVLRASPGFTAVAVVTLALGIGACAAVFSVVETVLLRPLPFHAPEELVNVEFSLTRNAQQSVPCSVPELDDLRSRSGVFAEVSMVFPMDGNLTGVAEPQRVEALAVSPSYFRLLGVAPTLGRTFGPEEESVPGWAQGCVLSHRAWLSYFGGDPAVVGRKFYMDYDTFRVIGVMPAGFRHPGRTLAAEVDVWFTGGLRTPPFTPQPQRDYRIIPGVIGRLARGQTLAVAQTRLEGFADQLRREYPRDYAPTQQWTPHVRSLQAALVGGVRGTLWFLFGAVALVLLICCVTVANLMLVRATRRRREMAVRSALGAQRGAIVRQLVIESLLVTTAGGLGGLTIAHFLPPVLLAHAPASVARLNELALNVPVLAFALVTSITVGILFGLLPALRATKFDLVPELKAGDRASGLTPRGRRWQGALIVGQTALSVVLVAGAALLLRSFLHAWQTDPGFHPEHVLTGRIWLPPPTDPNARQSYLSHSNRVALMRELIGRFGSLPGVEAAAVGTDVPLTGTAASVEVAVDHEPAAVPASGVALSTAVTPDYFRVLGIPLVQGRAFTEADDGRDAVVIVNAAAARRFWPGADPLGRRLGQGTGDRTQWSTVVGIVGNAKSSGLETSDEPHIYFPAYQTSGLGLAFFVRTAGAVSPLIGPVRQEIRRADADLPAYELLPMTDLLDRALSQRRFLVAIIGGFAALSLFLVALGLHGVIALTVAERRREFAVRLALGAGSADLLRLVVGRGLILAGAGLALGVTVGMAASLGLRGLLFEIHPLDPLTWTGVSLLLFAVSAATCWMPARRAAAIDPCRALAGE